MTVGWIDGSAGASGDMLLGALVDVGVPLDVMQGAIDDLEVGVTLRVEPVVRAGLGATKVHVDVPTTDTVRHLADVIELLASLDRVVRGRADATFRRLAAAEAEVHRTSVDDVHFHEVGALDSIADVVGVCAGFVSLGLERLTCSTLSLGSGTTRGAHGPIPVPAPAVLMLMRDVAPVAAGSTPHEATTPTGAALLAEWVDTWGPLPEMTPARIGTGAGTRDSDVVANVTRLIVGESATRAESADDADPAGVTRSTHDMIPTIETVPAIGTELVIRTEPVDEMVQVDANVDDLDPRIWPIAIEAAMGAGAVDAWITPIVMKKGRPAHTFSALCPPAMLEQVCTSIFRETSTIGVRHHVVRREVLERSESTVEVEDGTVGVKTALHRGVVVNRSVEWDDVVEVALRTGRPVQVVLAEATARAVADP